MITGLFQNHFKFVIASQHEIIYRRVRKEKIEIPRLRSQHENKEKR